MKKVILLSLVLTMIALAGSSCSRSDSPNSLTEEQIVAFTATAQANISALPPDIPIYENAENLKFAAGNTYITYEIPGTVDEIVAWYRAELEAQGWEKRNNSPESPLGGALTLLRSKPDKNISVTIQSIPDSGYVRVLISVIVK
jgi:hypothetical protein